MTTRTRLRPLAVAAALALAATSLAVPPAHAAPSVSVTSSLGSGRVSAEGGTTVTVTGSGFQSIQGGFGGVYVFFGWVNDPSGGSWRPSRGGNTGQDLLYVPDSEARDNQGFQRFVTFPGSSTAGTANGGEVSAAGGISFQMVIPGPQFTALDRDGNQAVIDCLQVQCGIITVGAHGVVNANNESFTPVQFVGAESSQQQAQPSAQSQETTQSQSQGGEQSAAPTPADADPVAGTAEAGAAADAGEVAAEVPEVPDVPATVGLSQQAVQAGRVLGFTGQGFAPGEQVVVTLGAGEAGAGPLTAGRFGEVAGAMTLPVGMRAGTHVIRLIGAGSGQSAEADVSVMADPATLNAATPQEVSPAWEWAWVAVFVAAGALLLLIVVSLVSALLKRRADKKSGPKRVRVRKGTVVAGQSATTGTSAPAPGAPEAAPTPVPPSDGATDGPEAADTPTRLLRAAR